MTRVIAFDHGTRRIGVAVADTPTAQAFERPALRPRAGDAVASALQLAGQEHAALAVVGLPRNMDGSEGPQAAAARAFGDALRANGLDVTYVDERLTSWQAAERLAVQDRRQSRKRRRRGDLDSAAARLILQDYLDARRSPEPSTSASEDQEAG